MKPTAVERLRTVKTAAQFCSLVDNATKEERAAIRAELQEWQTVARDGAAFHRRAAHASVVVALVAMVGIVALLAQVLATFCR